MYMCQCKLNVLKLKGQDSHSYVFLMCSRAKYCSFDLKIMCSTFAKWWQTRKEKARGHTCSVRVMIQIVGIVALILHLKLWTSSAAVPRDRVSLSLHFIKISWVGSVLLIYILKSKTTGKLEKLIQPTVSPLQVNVMSNLI